MQITPFFLAFAVGFYALQDNGTIKTPLSGILYASIGYILSFSTVFALMGTTGFRASGYIMYNIDDFRTAAAAAITLVSILLLISGLTDKGKLIRFLYLPIGILLGASFALAYSPCIPPVMSDIMNFASKPANAYKGLSLLTLYGVGLTTAFSVTGVFVSLVIGYFAGKKSTRRAIITLSSATLLVMAILIFTDMMIRYKSFLVGLALD
jgi:cytochrome c-type biogenesis protein